MKKIFAMGLALALSIGLLAGCGGGNGDATAPTTPPTTGAPETSAPETTTPESSAPAEVTTVETGKLHMSTNAAFPPYEMIADGEGFAGTGFEGVDVEVAGAIAAKLGLTLVVDDMDFNSVITAVQTGKADIAMAGLTVRPDRQENVDFTDSYATGVQVVIVKEDSPIASLDDLFAEGATYVVGTQESTTGNVYASEDLGEDRVVAYTNGATAVQALISGSVDCVLIDNEPAKAYVAANQGLKILDTEYVTEDYAIGVSKENPALREAVNAILNELIADGTVQGILDAYISAA